MNRASQRENPIDSPPLRIRRSRNQSASKPVSRFVDLLAICPRRKIGFRGAQIVGKTVILMELINNVAMRHGVILSSAVAERTREGNDLWLEMEPAIINRRRWFATDERTSAPAPHSPNGAHLGGVSATTEAGTCFYLSITFPFTQASSRGFNLLDVCLRRRFINRPWPLTWVNWKNESQPRKGSITGSRLRAGELTDPAPATTFAHLDATTSFASDGGVRYLPGRGSLDSTPVLDPHVVGQSTTKSLGRCSDLQRYKDLQDIIAICMDELSEDDKLTVARARKIRFLSQPFHVAKLYGSPALCSIKDTIPALQRGG